MLSSNRIRGPTRFGKALNLIFPKLSLQKMRGFGHATIFSQFAGSPPGTSGTMTPSHVINTKKSGLQIMSLAACASETNKQFTVLIFVNIFYKDGTCLA